MSPAGRRSDQRRSDGGPTATCYLGYYIPPPRAVGGARGSSAPVSTATLGLIQRQDPSLAAQLREDPASMMTQATRHRLYGIMRLIRAGMLGHMASLQQWEDAMRLQDDV